MRNAFRLLLSGVFLAVWSAAISGLGLLVSPAAIAPAFLSAHLVIALLGIIPLAVYIYRHWWLRRADLGTHGNLLLGTLTLPSLVVLAVTGVALLRWTSFQPLRALHDAGTVSLLLVLSLHLAHRFFPRPRAWLQEIKSAPLARWGKTGAVLLAGCLGLLLTGSLLAGRAPAGPAPIPLAHAGLDPSALTSAKTCATCHPDQAKQWASTAHALSPSDAYYQAVAGLFIEENGVEASRLCASCHNPVGLLAGEISEAQPVRSPTLPAPPAGVSLTTQKAYQVRSLRIALTISDQAAEGVTCVICHEAVTTISADQAHPANASLQLSLASLALPSSAWQDLALRASPQDHRSTLMQAVIRQAELCGACHNLSLPSGLPLERTFDEWRKSPYPKQGKTCQSCHMPAASSTLASGEMAQPLPAHGGQPGSPNSLPGFYNGTSLLQKAASLKAGLARDGQSLVATVRVTNDGAGHDLPTGSDDLREVWLEAVLLDSTGKEVWRSGGLDAYGALTPETVQFHRVIGDPAGQPVELHRIWAATQILTDTRLAPGETRAVVYRIPMPGGAGPFTFTVRLRYRPVPQSFAEFALDKPIKNFPVFEMAAQTVPYP